MTVSDGNQTVEIDSHDPEKQPEEYEDGDTGRFPADGVSTRLVDEEEVFGTLYEGYTWELEMMPSQKIG